MNNIYKEYVEFMKMCNTYNYLEAERMLKDIIVNVLEMNNTKFEIYSRNVFGSVEFDYVGKIKKGDIEENIAVDFKISNNKVYPNNTDHLIINAISENIKNIILVSNANFSNDLYEKKDEIFNKEGIIIQLLGKKELDEWFSVYQSTDDFINGENIPLILKKYTMNLAKEIAQDPQFLMKIEWRDLEKIIAKIFSEFGYHVKLTPGSKDGGKDVIVWYHGESYIIEIKHWKEPNKVGNKFIKQFLNITIKENRKLGLYLSSSGYTRNAFETLTCIEKVHLRYGDRSSIYSLCKMYERVNNGIYTPICNLNDIIEEISDKIE